MCGLGTGGGGEVGDRDEVGLRGRARSSSRPRRSRRRAPWSRSERPATYAMRVCPRSARWRTAAATPGPSSWQTAGNGLGTSGRLSVTAGSPSSSSSAIRGSAKRRSVRNTPSTRSRAREVAVARRFLLGVVADDLQQQRLAAHRQLEFDARDERGKERIGAQQQRVAGDHQAERVLASPAEGAGGGVRLPAEVGCDAEDPVTRVGGHARPAVERERHRGRRHAGDACDIHDRRPPPPLARSPHADVYARSLWA